MKKADVTPALVRELVVTQFPQWADLPIRPVDVDGIDNTTFRLGTDMAVRLPSSESYAQQVDKEHRWLPVLAPNLPLPIPRPLAKGVPGSGFPRPWSVYSWLDGDTALAGHIESMTLFAHDLADFLIALYKIDPADGPSPGPHNFYRGGPLEVYDGETKDALAALRGHIDTKLASEVWQTALDATWQGEPVWFHGDAQPGNLLVRHGRLSAVIDFGTSGVGDPACDTTIAWTFFRAESRRAFKSRLPFDAATWARGRGWAIWKAMIMLAYALESDPEGAARIEVVIDAVLADHREAGYRSAGATRAGNAPGPEQQAGTSPLGLEHPGRFL